MKLHSPLRIHPGTRVRLSRIDAGSTDGFPQEKDADAAVDRYRTRLVKRQEVLYAGADRGLLIVLQGMDTAGKDGTISHIFSGINPQGCTVTPFKVPTPLEAKHDFLWRCHAAVPPRGMIGIFNRSHYEDVLSPRVHGALSKKDAHRHMDEINAFEAMLESNGITVLKFFLHISAEEQKQRLQARLDDKDKHWKLSASDFAERKFWDEYQRCYADIFERTSTKDAPWFVIPANHKWYRNVVISGILADAMDGMKLNYPPATVDAASLKL